jgi:GNAT superfamily N-acetyltransferase
MMNQPFKLQPDDAERYWHLRQLMLTDTPWAFASDPESDNARDPAAFISRLSTPYNEILAIGADTGELIASAGVIRRPRKKIWHRADIWGVYVHHEHRSHGLGFAVVKAAVDEALSWPEVDSVCLSVSEHSDARRLYERVGFEQWGYEPSCLRIDGKSYDEIHMLYQAETG